MPTVTYQAEPSLAADEFIDVLVRSTLAERRPVHDLDAIRAMLKNADVILTARAGGLLVGVSRRSPTLLIAPTFPTSRLTRPTSVRESAAN